VATIEKNDSRRGYRQIALATTIPLIMLAAPAVGYAIGFYLDKLFGLSKILAVIFLLLGVAAGGMETFKIIKQLTKENKDLAWT